MAMVGPALEALGALEGLEAEAKGSGDAVSTKRETREAIQTNELKKHGNITHHFKLTETRTREGQYEETTDLDEVDDKKTTANEDGNKSRKCGCFGFLRFGKSRK